jgi:hypothetical protein
MTNRIAHLQPDYIFLTIRRPQGWVPEGFGDRPPKAEVLSSEHVASFEEARDDLLRINRLSVRHNLDTWAVVISPDAGL